MGGVFHPLDYLMSKNPGWLRLVRRKKYGKDCLRLKRVKKENYVK